MYFLAPLFPSLASVNMRAERIRKQHLLHHLT
jgi:hypothetical protein